MARQLMFMPQWDPNAESLVTGPSQDDHDGGPAAGVASGFDPSGGEPCYQFGNQWVCSIVVSELFEAVTVGVNLALSVTEGFAVCCTVFLFMCSLFDLNAC
jgi:hypothetical protein